MSPLRRCIDGGRHDAHFRISYWIRRSGVRSAPRTVAGLGWKVFSHQLAKEPEVCFYGSANVFRANGRLSVWTKCLGKADLDNAVKADAIDMAAEKIAHDYTPPIAKLTTLQGDRIVDAVMNEELANNGSLRPLVTALREIDCSKRRARDLSIIIIPMDGQVHSSDTPQDWHPVPNIGELASLSRLLCAPPATVRPHQRWTLPGKLAAKFNGRRRQCTSKPLRQLPSFPSPLSLRSHRTAKLTKCLNQLWRMCGSSRVISGDKSRLRAYCELPQFHDQILQATDRKDADVVDALIAKMEDLEQRLGPE